LSVLPILFEMQSFENSLGVSADDVKLASDAVEGSTGYVVPEVAKSSSFVPSALHVPAEGEVTSEALPSGRFDDAPSMMDLVGGDPNSKASEAMAKAEREISDVVNDFQDDADNMVEEETVNVGIGEAKLQSQVDEVMKEAAEQDPIEAVDAAVISAAEVPDGLAEEAAESVVPEPAVENFADEEESAEGAGQGVEEESAAKEAVVAEYESSAEEESEEAKDPNVAAVAAQEVSESEPDTEEEEPVAEVEEAGVQATAERVVQNLPPPSTYCGPVPESVELKLEETVFEPGHFGTPTDFIWVNEKLVLTAGEDGEVMVWDMGSLEKVLSFRPYRSEAVSMLYLLPTEPSQGKVINVLTLSETSRVLKEWQISAHKAELKKALTIPDRGDSVDVTFTAMLSDETLDPEELDVLDDLGTLPEDPVEDALDAEVDKMLKKAEPVEDEVVVEDVIADDYVGPDAEGTKAEGEFVSESREVDFTDALEEAADEADSAKAIAEESTAEAFAEVAEDSVVAEGVEAMTESVVDAEAKDAVTNAEEAPAVAEEASKEALIAETPAPTRSVLDRWISRDTNTEPEEKKEPAVVEEMPRNKSVLDRWNNRSQEQIADDLPAAAEEEVEKPVVDTIARSGSVLDRWNSRGAPAEEAAAEKTAPLAVAEKTAAPAAAVEQTTSRSGSVLDRWNNRSVDAGEEKPSKPVAPAAPAEDRPLIYSANKSEENKDDNDWGHVDETGYNFKNAFAMFGGK